MGRFRVAAAMPFVALLIAVGVGWTALSHESDQRTEAIQRRIDAEAKLREALATETRDRVADNERQIARLKATNLRQTQLILALAREFPQLADDLTMITDDAAARPSSTAAYPRPSSGRATTVRPRHSTPGPTPRSPQPQIGPPAPTPVAPLPPAPTTTPDPNPVASLPIIGPLLAVLLL